MEEMLEQLLEECRPYTQQGEVATYIPELAKGNRNDLGIYVLLSDGRHYQAGDYQKCFTIQSVVKPILLLLALMGLAKPSLYLWMGALLLVLLVVRIPKLGVKCALLFTIFQPFAILDSGFQRAKFISSGMYFGRFVTGEMQARLTSLQQTSYEEKSEEYQDELQIRNLARESREKQKKQRKNK